MLVKQSWLDDGLQAALDAIHKQHALFVEETIIKSWEAESIGTLRTPKYIVLGYSRGGSGMVGFFVWPDLTASRFKF